MAATPDWHPGLLTTAPGVVPEPVELAEVRLALLGVNADTVSIAAEPRTRTEAAECGFLIVRDPEGAPLAALKVSGMTADGRVTGTVVAVDGSADGPFADLRRPPAAAALPGALALVGHDPPDDPAMTHARMSSAPVLFVVLDGPRLDPGPGLADTVRATRDLAGVLAADGRKSDVIVLPAPEYGDERDARLRTAIATAYGAASASAASTADRRALLDALDQPGDPDGLPGASVRAWRRFRPPRNERGLVVFFTGLSGSGKSTLARALVEALAERTERTVTLLDGDVVRRLLSAGLGFSRADRDLNILRIGYVAAEIARHGGVAVCAPIAPFAEARRKVREMVSATGDFFLVHVATPLDECERRDRKGLYARARNGEIPEFTGISSPYEPPVDADLVVDTIRVSIPEAIDRLVAALREGGWLRPS